MGLFDRLSPEQKDLFKDICSEMAQDIAEHLRELEVSAKVPQHQVPVKPQEPVSVVTRNENGNLVPVTTTTPQLLAEIVDRLEVLIGLSTESLNRYDDVAKGAKRNRGR